MNKRAQPHSGRAFAPAKFPAVGLSMVACAVSLGVWPAGANAQSTLFGSITDAAGDGSSADIRSASIAVNSSGMATFTVNFAPGTTMGNTRTSFYLDTDQNPATGAAGVNGGHGDASLIGWDYAVYIKGSSFQVKAELRRYDAKLGRSVPAGTYPVNYGANSASVIIPIAALGSSNGLMNFKLTSCIQYSQNSYSAILDYAPDLGQPVGVVMPHRAGTRANKVGASDPSAVVSPK